MTNPRPTDQGDGEAHQLTPSTFPALSNLEKRQQQLAERLRRGFRETEDLFYWLQDLSVVTFGYIENDFLTGAYTERVMRLLLMTGDGFQGVRFDHLDELDPRKAYEFRLRIEESKLNPAFQAAYRDLRNNANEYVDPEERPPPDPEAPVALRPSLQRLDERQRAALDTLFDGFDTSEEILDWGRELNAATYGELPVTLLTRMRGPERVIRHHLLNDSNLKYRTNYAESFREMFAAAHILPAFNNGVRTLTGAAGERSDIDDDENEGMSPEVGA